MTTRKSKAAVSASFLPPPPQPRDGDMEDLDEGFPITRTPSQNLQPGDQRIVIEKAAHKHTGITTSPWGSMTPEQIQAAMDLWKEKQNAEPETRPGDQRERSKEQSGESRGSVFDRIAKNLKKPPEDARDEIRKAALRERIRKEEEAKAQESIERRIREEEAKLKRKAHRIHVSSDSEPEKESKQEQMARALRDLKRKVEGDMEVGAAATPFTKSLEATPRESGLKHFNFDSFDGLADPEEHLNYFKQISNIYDYSDLTRCRFFASTLKGALRNGSAAYHPGVWIPGETSARYF